MMTEQLKTNYSEVSYGIITPQWAEKGLYFDDWITDQSEEWQRESCVQIRRYLHKECNYGMSFDASLDCWKYLEIRAFTKSYWDDNGEEFQGLIGVAAFDTNTEYTNKVGIHTCMEFCWIHPFYRKKGLMRKEWSKFIEKYGNFIIAEPFSAGMEKLLEAVEYVAPTLKDK